MAEKRLTDDAEKTDSFYGSSVMQRSLNAHYDHFPRTENVTGKTTKKSQKKRLMQR